jgi:hypothetical protein
MKPQADLCIYAAFLMYILLSGCRGGNSYQNQEVDTANASNTVISVLKNDTIVSNLTVEKQVTIYGDTVWVNPYGSQEWIDTTTDKTYSALVSVAVDTTDFIIDTVKSRKGDRIVIGYNHIYKLEFARDNKSWFTVSFDKKNDLEKVLGETDYWLESNLDVFQNLVYNKTYDLFIIEYDINPRYNFGTVYYIVFDTEGEIQYVGTSGNWGGGGPDWDSFLTYDDEMYVTSYELYSFSKRTSFSIADYTKYADILKELQSTAIAYKQVHAVRDLLENVFLVVYEQSNGNPEYNALILNTDSSILDRFRYNGLMEDADALLLFFPDTVNSRYFVHDTEREVLVCIETRDSLDIKEISESVMKELPDDTLLSDNYIPIDFESFGSKIFYVSSTDSVMFYNGGIIE